MRQIKGLLYFYLTNAKHSFKIFWTILMSILVVTMTVAYFMKDVGSGSFTFTLSVAIYIYCAIYGFLAVKETVPFSLKRGAVRKNIFISLGIFFFVIALAKAMTASTIRIVVDFITTKLEISNFALLHVAYFTNDTWLNRILIDTSISFISFSVLFVLGLIFYRYGLAGGGTVLGLLVIFILTGVGQGWLIDFFVDQFSPITHMFYLQLFAIGIIVYTLSMFLLRKITIEKTV